MKRRGTALTLVAFLLLTGCGVRTPEQRATQAPEEGVDIVVPYATTTIAPVVTPATQALYINSEGKVSLNDAAILESAQSEEEAVSEYKQLRLGSTGTDVSCLQERLTDLGYYTEGISGIYDEATEEAVKRFERSFGVMQTGVATAALQERLYSDEATVYLSDAYMDAVESRYVRLEKGDTGSDVIALQLRLIELGYPLAEATGVYDEATADAVREVYRVYGYKGKNYVSEVFQKVFYSDDARRYSTEKEQQDDGLTYRAGDSGSEVLQLQIRLKELGYLDAASDTFDERMQAAVCAFQDACLMEADGEADVILQRELFRSDAPRKGEVRQLYNTLTWGDSGDEVLALQQRLIALYYEGVREDGIFGDDLVAVVKQFQNAAGMKPTGVADIAMQELLFSDDPPLSPEKQAEMREDEEALTLTVQALIPGDEGEEVTALQERLAYLGFYTGSVDGDFGNGTRRAVTNLQSALGVTTNGEASGDLICLIRSSAAPKAGEKYWKETQHFTALAVGDTGDEVLEMQKRLYKLGWLDAEALGEAQFGTYEEKTAEAVRAIQKSIGWPRRDGSAATEFLTWLYSDAADKAEVSAEPTE